MVFFFFCKLSQNKTEPQTEHRTKEWKNQVQNKTEGRTEWEEREERGFPAWKESTSNRWGFPKDNRSFPEDPHPGHGELRKAPGHFCTRSFFFSFSPTSPPLFFLRVGPKNTTTWGSGMGWCRWIRVSTSGKNDSRCDLSPEMLSKQPHTLSGFSEFQ